MGALNAFIQIVPFCISFFVTLIIRFFAMEEDNQSKQVD